ncbi:hypothetical protein SO802_030304 [Lithocarpus litseifolius]|uniref:Uncharacterized protein n=1 Tax=Lithocarpus litseifolius TaxID=425828 RepID=A0AAW2BIW7_9ROSI
MTKEKHGYIYSGGDTWIPNHPTKKVLHPPLNIEEEMMVAELLDPDLQWWDRGLIMQNFNQEDAEAILQQDSWQRRRSGKRALMEYLEGKYGRTCGSLMYQIRSKYLVGKLVVTSYPTEQTCHRKELFKIILVNFAGVILKLEFMHCGNVEWHRMFGLGVLHDCKNAPRAKLTCSS